MLIYNRKSSITGEKIASALNLKHGNNLMPFHDEDSPPFLVRWGTSFSPEIDGEFEKVINPAESIKKATNKFLSLQIMSENNIKVPPFSEDPFELVEEYGYPILGRRIEHARGTDIKLCLQERDFATRKDFYTVYIPTKREFRIHVVGGTVCRVQGKYLDIPGNQNGYIRNYATGYRFRNPRLRLRSERLQAAISAVSALGLDFGAVDLILSDDNSCYILEVNTAPSCSPLTGAGYVVGIGRLLDGFGVEINLDALDLLNEVEGEDEEEWEENDEG